MKPGGGQSRSRPPMQQNLRRARKAMKKMVQFAEDEPQEASGGGGGMLLDDRRFKRQRGALPRKRRRKEERRLKKAKKHAFICGKKLDELEGTTKHKSSKKSKAEPKPKAVSARELKSSEQKRRKEEKFKKDQEESRKRQLLKANEDEDKNIRRLERDLNFRKKRKTREKITPTAFMDDGLDYLLDIVDPSKLEDAEDEMDGLLGLGKDPDSDDDDGEEDDKDDDVSDDDDAGFEEDEEEIDSRTGKRMKAQNRREKIKKTKTDEDRSDMDDGSDSEGVADDDDEVRLFSREKHRTSSQKKRGKPSLGDGDDASGGDSSYSQSEDDADNDDDDSDNEEDEEVNDSEDSDDGERTRAPKMDPYGNIIGEKPAERPATYIPPHKRAEMMGQSMSAERQAKLDRLRKQLKGAINRLSESNALSICNQIEELYLSNSRNDMNETLTSLVQDVCIGSALTPNRLAMEHVLMVAVLHATVGSEVGAHLLQSLASQFDSLHGEDGSYGNGKEIDNIIMLLIHLFNFRIVHCALIYDLIRRLVERFTERDIEMLLQVLKSAGTTLRKDDPSSLKDIILLIQGKANQCPDELKQQSRVKFMLETISALRNNNLRKIPNYDPTDMDRLRKLHRHMIKERGHNDNDSTLRISLADLLTAHERGRWWIVGSAWSGHGPQLEASEQSSMDTASASLVGVDNETSQKIMELSRQQRMNTDLRRTIFSLIMTAEDYTDAFEKLVRLGHKGGRDREVVHVVLDCCQQEKVFNPYYAHLASKLCQFDRKFRMAFQFAFWDKIRLLEELPVSSCSNLALLVSHLISTKVLSLAVLKVVEFADINKHTVRFLRAVLLDLLLEQQDNAIISIFGGVAMATKFRILREGLGLFMHHFLMKTSKKQMALMTKRRGDGVEELLKKKVALADSAMQGEEGPVKL